MTHRLPVPVSLAFEATARGAQFRDRVAIVVRASPEAIFQALHEVALRDMKLAFDAFADPNHEKLFMSIRVAPTGQPDEHWLVLEHATRALSPVAERRFSRYWRVIKPLGAFVSWQLLGAVRRKAERAETLSRRGASDRGMFAHRAEETGTRSHDSAVPLR